MITHFRNIQDLTKTIKSVWPDCIIIIGGSLPTTAPTCILEKIDADIYFIGEGDERIKTVLQYIGSKKSLKDIPGLKIKTETGIFSTKGNIYPPDIIKTPRPCYEAFPIETYIDFIKKSGRCFDM